MKGEIRAQRYCSGEWRVGDGGEGGKRGKEGGVVMIFQRAFGGVCCGWALAGFNFSTYPLNEFQVRYLLL